MPLYPLPLILAIIIWATIFYSTGKIMMISSIVVISLGLIMFFVAKSMKWIGSEGGGVVEEEKA
jgi:hypothetical protein